MHRFLDYGIHFCATKFLPNAHFSMREMFVRKLEIVRNVVVVALTDWLRGLTIGVVTLMRYLDEVSRDEVQGSQLLKNQKMRPSERTFL